MGGSSKIAISAIIVNKLAFLYGFVNPIARKCLFGESGERGRFGGSGMRGEIAFQKPLKSDTV
jgi:hypothetical protein